MSRPRLVANLLAAIPMGWIFAFIALGNLKGECLVGDPCFPERAVQSTIYGAVFAAIIAMIILVIFVRKKST